MKTGVAIFAIGICASASVSSVSAFSPIQRHDRIIGTSAASASTSKKLAASTFYDGSTASSGNANAAGLIDISEYNELEQRDVYSMEEWAAQCGAQKLPGIELYSTTTTTHSSSSSSSLDWSLFTRSFIPAASTVLYVPSRMVLNSDDVADEYGGQLEAAENALAEMDREAAKRLPLFRLLIKILAEYERGRESEFYSWLNSLPRQFYNGVAMTDACFECLPPYAAILSINERNTYSRFLNALRQGFVPLSDEIVENDQIVKWAYNVALTRFHEVWEPTHQKLIAPMADMMNHSAEPNVEITFDAEGNCIVQSLCDIQPESALTVSLGDPTNPTTLFAKYGFLSNDCQTIFCKAIHLEPQIKELGYEYRDLLFGTETGEISPKVWDTFLYAMLQMNDPAAAEGFYAACTSNDDGTKQEYHNHYFQYTLDALKNHVHSILQDVDQLTMKAQTYDLATHPRVPVIVAHNNLVRETFAMTASMLEQMG